MTTVLRSLRLLLCLGLSIQWISATAIAEESDDIEGIIRRWKTASTAIRTAKVKCFHANFGAHLPDDLEDLATEKLVETSMTSEQFRTLFHDRLVPLFGKPRIYTALQRETTSFLKTAAQVDVVWSELTILQDGRAARNDEQYDGNRCLRLSMFQRHCSYDVATNTATISGSDMPFEQAITVNDLRFVPAISSEASPKFRIENMSDERAMLVAPGAELVFNPDSGFAFHCTSRHGASGKIRRETWQALPRTYPGGITLPSISATITYENTANGEPQLFDADLFVIDAAEFNREIPPPELALPVPKGTSIIDWSGSGGSLTADKEIPNLATFKFPAIRRASAIPAPGLLPIPDAR